MKRLDLSTLGSILAVKLSTSRMDSHWLGNSVTVYAKFSIDVKPGLPFNVLRNSLLEAVEAHGPVPEGFYETTCFIRQPSAYCGECDA